MAAMVGTVLIGLPVHDRMLGLELEAGLRLSQTPLAPGVEI